MSLLLWLSYLFKFLLIAFGIEKCFECTFHDTKILYVSSQNLILKISKPYLFILLFIYLFICLFIYLFSTYLFFFLFYLAFCFQLLFCLFTLSFTSSHGLFYIIYYASFSLSRYVPNLLLLVLQYHYLISTYLLHIN